LGEEMTEYEVRCMVRLGKETRVQVVRRTKSLQKAIDIAKILQEGANSNPRSSAIFYVKKVREG